MTLWYDKPAEDWLQALPVGNGTVAAMVFGGTTKERLQLNHADLWAGQPHDYASPDALAALPEIRRLIFAGEYEKAQKLTGERFMSVPLRQKPYQTLGNLWITRTTSESLLYRRELDLETATVHTKAGEFSQEVFASYPDGVIVVRITGGGDFALEFDSLHTKNKISSEKDALILSGQSDSVKFEAQISVRCEGSGKVTSENNKLLISGAKIVTLFLSMATSYISWKDISGDPAAQNQKNLDRVREKSYSALRKAHIADYRKLYARTNLDLGPQPERPTDIRVREFARGKDPQLAALHFAFGRYLLIACSRPGGRPATLQGLWNDSLTPPWDSKYTININTQMNYWPAGPANLLECYEPLLTMLPEVAESGERTARTQYGARGWVCHHNTDGWRGTAPVDGAFWGMWPLGGAWLCKSIRDHYEFSTDDVALKSRYPLLKGACEFFLDALASDPTTDYLVTCPSNSPENAHHRDVSLCAGPSMDNQILRDLFDATLFVAEKFGLDSGFCQKVKAAREKLPPDRIGKGGQLQEWQADWDLEAPEQHHRHVSHLYALFPSDQITPDKTPALAAAARNSLERRGDRATGWSLAWKLNLWARLHDGERAYALLSGLLTPERTAPNLFDLHPPFQIDGNFGAVSGVCELLLQSHAGELHLLPALPKAWPTGRVTGLLARGGVTVDIAWQSGKLTEAQLRTTKSGPVTIRYNGDTRTLTLRARRRTRVL
jgi:alpha-L-fucosidase 2